MVVCRASVAGSLLGLAVGAGVVFEVLDLASDVEAEVAVLSLRTGARDVVVVAGTTDCRFVEGVARGADLGATTLDGRLVGFAAITLEGRALGVAVGAFGLVAAGAGCATMRMIFDSRMNSPWPGGHVKYRSPRTEPSFFPAAVGSSIPSQSPSATWMAPTYFTRPCCCVDVSTVWPILKADMAKYYLPVAASEFGMVRIAGIVSKSRVAIAGICGRVVS
jgi:hypothetical protein